MANIPPKTSFCSSPIVPQQIFLRDISYHIVSLASLSDSLCPCLQCLSFSSPTDLLCLLLVSLVLCQAEYILSYKLCVCGPHYWPFSKLRVCVECFPFCRPCVPSSTPILYIYIFGSLLKGLSAFDSV